jgi:hypothetical protein
LDLTAIAARAAADAGGASPAFLEGYIEMLDAVVTTGRRLARDNSIFAVLRVTPADQNVSLRGWSTSISARRPPGRRSAQSSPSPRDTTAHSAA